MNKHLTSSNVIATVALVFAVGGGSAYAATTIGSGQIKDNSVQSKDIKNGTIATKDLSSSTLSALKGKAGATGAKGEPGTPGTAGAKGDQGAKGDTGAPGSDVFASAAPAGSKLQGVTVSTFTGGAAETFRLSASYPVLLSAAPAVKINPGVYAASVGNSAEDTTNCGGTAAAPVVAPGYACFYVTTATNLGADSLFIYSGSMSSAEATADRAGFFVAGETNAAGSTTLRGVWAVTAP